MSQTNSQKNIAFAFFINIVFTILEFIGGLLTGSIAIMSDSLHDFGDSLSLGLSWFLQKFSNKKEDDKYTYGYKRFSLLGAFINSIILIIGSIFIIQESIPRLLNPTKTNSTGMILISIVGIIFNLIAFYRLQGKNNMNEKVLKWHLLEDVLGWIAILMGSITIYFTQWYIIDPILSILIAVYILFHIIQNFKDTMSLFLQKAPDEINVSKLIEDFKEIPGVLNAQHIHVWSLDSEEHVLSAHLIVNNEITISEYHNIKKQVNNLLVEYKVHHITIEIKREEELY